MGEFPKRIGDVVEKTVVVFQKIEQREIDIFKLLNSKLNYNN